MSPVGVGARRTSPSITLSGDLSPGSAQSRHAYSVRPGPVAPCTTATGTGFSAGAGTVRRSGSGAGTPSTSAPYGPRSRSAGRARGRCRRPCTGVRGAGPQQRQAWSRSFLPFVGTWGPETPQPRCAPAARPPPGVPLPIRRPSRRSNALTPAPPGPRVPSPRRATAARCGRPAASRGTPARHRPCRSRTRSSPSPSHPRPSPPSSAMSKPPVRTRRSVRAGERQPSRLVSWA